MGFSWGPRGELSFDCVSVFVGVFLLCFSVVCSVSAFCVFCFVALLLFTGAARNLFFADDAELN